MQLHPAVAGCFRGVVGGPQEARLQAEIGVDALHVEGMVAGGDGIDVRSDLGTLNLSDVPTVMVEQDSERLAEMTRQDMAQRGMDVAKLPFPSEMFKDKAERRVRLGLILSQLVADNNLQATQDQVKAQIEDFSQSYEDPKEVLKYYFSDRRRLGEVEALVLEENVVNYVLGKAKVSNKTVAFDELMGSVPQA